MDAGSNVVAFDTDIGKQVVVELAKQGDVAAVA